MSRLRILVGIVLIAVGLASTAAVRAQGAAEDADGDAGSPIDWYGDLRLRGELTRDIPGRPDDLERVRASVRAGGRVVTESGWEVAAAVKLGVGSDDNEDTRRNLDNEESDGAGFDEWYAAYSFSDRALFRLGKGRMPLLLSPMVWDRDLRPVGASVEYSREMRDFDALYVTAGYFAGDHLYGDESRIGALQIGYGWMEGAETGFSAFLSYLDFDDLDVLAREGLGRTNRRVGNQFVSDFQLLDLQLIARTQAYEAPLVARLDLVRNLGADDLRDGARFSLVWGNADELGGWELGYSIQRIQRDAVLAAFNEDDWWFHSFARGYMPWVAYGISEHWAIQASAFIERRDGIDEYTDRYLLDVRSRW
jgi:hypothetical protein